MTQHCDRPLSPHLSIYKPQISSVLSIMHRITGVVLFICILDLAWFMILLLGNGIGFSFVDWDLVSMSNTWWFKLYIICLLFCLYYHLLNGIRHLLWDAGFGFEKSTMHKTGWGVVVLTIVMTAFTLYLMLQ